MVDFVVPTFNGGKYLHNLLGSLGAQSVNSHPIIIDSSSADNTADVVRQFDATILTIARNDFNHGKTRNLGINQSANDVAVFFTQDASPTDAYCLENLIKPLADPQIVASFGRQIPRPGASPTETFTRLFNYPETPMVKGREDLSRLGIKTFFFSNVCSAIKTKEFKELGGFPENIVMFEDLIFAAKAIMAGYKIAYVPEATVWHSHNFALPQLFQRYRDAGLSLRNYPWILEHGKTDREGLAFLWAEIRHLAHNGLHQWIPHAFAESVFKFAGFWFGLHGIGAHRVPKTTVAPKMKYA